MAVIFFLCSICAKAQSFSTNEITVGENYLQQFNLTSNDTATKRSPFVIGNIIITGNKKTKPYIIEREITFKEGDTVFLNELVKQFEFARQQIYNTRLFTQVIVSLKAFRGYVVDIEIDVKERWYLFPIPYFKPIDRNLTAWADKGYSTSRINYGLKLSWYNVSGRNDKLKFWLVTGYTQQLELVYEQPYADKTLKHGYGINISYATQKELNVNTINNDQVFLNADSIGYAGKYITNNFNARLSYFYRPGLLSKHNARVGYTISNIDSAVTVANPNYYGNGKQQLKYPEIGYTWDYAKIDYVAYPQKGVIAQVDITQKGFSKEMNITQLSAKVSKAWKFKYKTSYLLQGGGVLKVPFDQPYINQRMFGYGDYYLRGYEKYVIDGVASFMLRNTFRKQFLDFKLTNFRKNSRSNIPFFVYAKAYSDVGYSYSKFADVNSLTNRMLYTWGAGIDVVTLYDLVFRFEYSIPQKGQGGFFFHVKNDF